ncbi:Phosphoglycerol transferase MdoB [Streptomyces sp. 1222.2]|uniref:sulfatase n=1 Tax=Streptomyces sp. 1222.2 TaxID=1938833 RepID=UPI000BDD48FB|nr:sulfatase [Streptomyces sp. 1222.2]SOD68833.1 Phosphoglycerol transferase MdoB [Streptomyces sp. 1222.2]
MSHIRSPQLPGPTPAPDDDKTPDEAAPPEPTSEAGSPDAAVTATAGEQATAEAGTETEPAPGVETEPEPEATSEPEAEPAAKAKSEAKSEAKSGSRTESAPEAETQTESEPATKSEPMTEAEPEPEPMTEPDSASEQTSDPGSNPDRNPEPEPESEPEQESAPDAQPEPTATSAPAPSPSPSPSPSPTPAAAPSGWRVAHPRAARALTWAVTGLAVALVMFALLVPNDITRIEFGRFLRIPAEGILVAGLLLVLPTKARRVAVVVVGVLLGLLTIVKVLDMGSYWTLDRPFDLVLDWILLDDAQSFMKDSLGGAAAQAATVGVILLALALPVLMTLAVVRISRLMVRHRHTAGRTLLVLGTAWITCSTLTLEVADVPVASHSAATLVENRIEAVNDGLKDGEAFRKQSAVDAFADVPPDQLLTGLRGKDVLITFIESYGRSAIDDPRMGEPLSQTLAQKTQELKDAGYASQSGWLRSPITGAGSWLGHSTFLSGLWIKNQSRYANLVASDRLTLTEAFRRTGAWRTVGVVPGTQMAWPEGKYFGLNHIYDSDQLGYRGPKFSWSTMPDQYTLKAFEELEHGKKDRGPMMAEIILTSSHNPWAPIPRTIPDDQVGDGSVYHSLQKAEGKNPTEVWKDPLAVRDEYRKSIQYSVSSLVDFVAKHGSRDTVLVFLGDHQPNKTVTGDNPSHDVPVSIVAKDPEVLKKVADWGWTDGLQPAGNTPVWRMDKFRDRFMTAFGPQGETAP